LTFDHDDVVPVKLYLEQQQ